MRSFPHRKMLVKPNIVKSTTKVAVVVTCHEAYTPFLAKVLRSINSQSIKFDQKILVLDDCTAKQPLDWKIVEVDFKNPNASRNAGLEEIDDATWVVFWDGDNLMSLNFLEEHLLTLKKTEDTNVAFFYPSVSYRTKINLLTVADESKETRKLNPPEWDYWRFREKTYVDTSSLWNVHAIRSVGGWSVLQPKLDDWCLSLNVTRAGWIGKKSSAIAYISEHSDRRSSNHNTTDALWFARSIGVVTLWGNKSLCQEELIDWYREAEFPPKTSIYWIDNSGESKLSKKLWEAAAELRNKFISFTIVTLPTPYEHKEGRNKKASERHQHVANLYNIIIPKINDDLILTVEDDNLPGFTDLRTLSNALTPWSKIGAVGAAYRARNAPHVCCASGHLDFWMNCPNFNELSEDKIRVGMVGGGFTLYQNSVIKRILPFECKMHEKNGSLIGWDGNIGRKLTKLGYETILHGGVKVKHRCAEVIEWEKTHA